MNCGTCPSASQICGPHYMGFQILKFQSVYRTISHWEHTPGMLWWKPCWMIHTHDPSLLTLGTPCTLISDPGACLIWDPVYHSLSGRLHPKEKQICSISDVFCLCSHWSWPVEHNAWTMKMEPVLLPVRYVAHIIWVFRFSNSSRFTWPSVTESTPQGCSDESHVGWFTHMTPVCWRWVHPVPWPLTPAPVWSENLV